MQVWSLQSTGTPAERVGRGTLCGQQELLSPGAEWPRVSRGETSVPGNPLPTQQCGHEGPGGQVCTDK